jgi:hypothetical protein
MKKLLVAAMFALAVTMASQQRASAWKEVTFSAGINFHMVSSGNRLLWGLYETSPLPGSPPLPSTVIASGYPGGYPGYVMSGYGPAVDGLAQAAPVAPAATAPAATQYSYNPYYNSGYQPVGYYYYSGYGQQTPGYWYGR